MSCVAALVHDGTVHLAADSFHGFNNRRVPGDRSTSKLFRHPSGLIIGSTGPCDAARRLRTLTLPSIGAGQTIESYALDTLCPAMASHAGGDVEYLVALDGLLFHGFSDGTAFPAVDGFAAIGSGGMYALGSLATPSDGAPATRVRRAVRIAERYTPTVAGPFVELAGKAATRIPGRERGGIKVEFKDAWRGEGDVIDLAKHRAAA